MFRRLVVLSALVTLVAVPCLAGKSKKAAPEAAPMPAMSPEEQAKMEACAKAMVPGDGHAALEPMVGTFKATVTMWMSPGAEPTVSTGTAVNKWMLGGRYLQGSFASEFMGEPFTGLGYTGYDNVQGKYVGTWMDTMGTGIMSSVGEQSSPTEFTFIAKMWDPMTGKETTLREKITIKDRDNHAFEMWGAGPDGVAFKTMEISYTRR
jgi:hypothetical protein